MLHARHPSTFFQNKKNYEASIRMVLGDNKTSANYETNGQVQMTSIFVRVIDKDFERDILK